MESMNGSTVNSSPSSPYYYWAECSSYSGGLGTLGGHSAGLLILFITYYFEFIVGLPANLWLLSHIIMKRSKVGGFLPADFFPFHLALAQLVFFIILPLIMVNHYRWQSNKVLSAMAFLNSMIVVMKPLLLCLVCMERYMAVVRPLVYLRYKVRHYRWGCLASSFCIYILVAVCGFLGFSPVMLCVFFIPVFIIDTFCCLSILKTLQKPPPGDNKMIEIKKIGREVARTENGKQEDSKKREERKENRLKKDERDVPRGREEMNSMKRKAFITIAIIQAVLTLNYLPFIIILPLERFVPTRMLKCQFLCMAFAAATSCSYLKPLLYLHRLWRQTRQKS